MNRTRHRVPRAVAGVLALALGASAATVTNTSPRGWEAVPTTHLAVVASLDSELGSPTNFVLHSAWRGKLPGVVTNDGASIVFTLPSPPLPGETIESTLSGPDTAFAWRFLTTPEDGNTSFVTNSVVLDTAGSCRFRNIALADIQGDNSLDIVAPSWGSNAVLIASGLTPVASTTQLARVIQDVAVGDFDSDGSPDLLLGCATQAFAVALNTGAGFTPGSGVQTIAGVSGPLRQVVVGDLNRDGSPDAVTIAETSGHVVPLLNNGSGSLTPGAAIACTSPLYGLDVGDLNRDGSPDAVTVGPAGYLAILSGNGTGGFLAPVVHTVCPQTLYACRIADFNQDGYADIAAVGAEGVVIVGTGSASGFTFAGIDHGLSLTTLYGLAVGDCDANGFPDIAACGGANVAVLLGSAGGFSPRPSPLVLPDELLRDVEIGDLDDDGCLDLAVCGLVSGKTHIFWNNPASIPLIRGTNGAVIVSGEPASLAKGTDFGSILGFSTISNRFSLINRGKGVLLIESVQLSGLSTDILQVLNMPATVLPGSTSTFDIVCTPVMTGTIAAVLSISNNSPTAVSNAASPYIINLAGQVVKGWPSVFGFDATNQTYDGTAKEVTVMIEPSSLASSVVLLYDGQAAPPTNAGSYTVTATVETELYSASVSAILTIAKRPLTALCPDASRVYGETNPVFSVTLTNFVDGEGLDQIVELPTASCLAMAPAPVGLYDIVAFGGSAANYTFISSNGTLSVTQAVLTIRADDKARLFGTPNPPLTISYAGWKNGEGTNALATLPEASTLATDFSPAGLYAITVAGATAINYACVHVPGTLAVVATAAEVTVTNRLYTYDGTPKSVSVSTDPPGLDVVITYNGVTNEPVSAGVYDVYASIQETNYAGSNTAVLTILKASAEVTVTNRLYTYDGTPKSVAVSTVPPGLATAVTYNGSASAPATAGVYAVTAWITAPNHCGTNTAVLTILKAAAAVSISNTVQTYDGAPKSVSVSTVPPGLATAVTYNGSASAPVTAGVYAVTAWITAPNHCGTNSAVLTILKANQALTAFLPPDGIYPADQLLTLSAVGSPSGIPVSFAIRSGPAEMASSNQFRFLDFGVVAVAAWQPANANWNASPVLTNRYSAVETNTVHYAAKAGQIPRWPYASWATAASNIQVAADLASPSETVLVGAGRYDTGGRPAPDGALTNRLVVEKPLLVLAVDGPAATILAGAEGSGSDAPLGPAAVRCAWLADGALLSGFTLTNGFTDSPFADAADYSGGGAGLAPGGLISNCVIAGCGAVVGGGLWGGSATRCDIRGNTALQEGGGAAKAWLDNSLLRDNRADYGGGAFRAGLLNCTLAANDALYGGGAFEGTLVNCIAWNNTGWDCFGSTASHTDAGSGVTDGVDGCRTADPLFVDPAAGNYRLAYGSPGINAGDNGIVPPLARDLEGALRVVHGTVDMGAYEFFGTPGIPVLAPPSDIRAHQASLQWQQPDDGVRVIHFRIAVSNLAVAGPGLVTLVDAPALSGIVTGLAPETAYACRIRAENDYDMSGWSGWQSFTTLTEAAILTATSLTFHTTFDAGGALTQDVALANGGATPCIWDGSIRYTTPLSDHELLAIPAGDWLTVSPAGGTVPAFGSSDLLFTVVAGHLNAGTYRAWHTVASPHATNSPAVQIVTLNIGRATDSIVFGPTNQIYDGTPRVVTATAGSGEPVTVTYNGSPVPPVNAGLYAITGVVNAANWTAVATAWLTVARAPQAITAFLPASGDVPSTNRLTVSASGGGSGQPVTFAIASGPGALQPDNRVLFSDYGDILVVANQAGAANWLPAPPVTNIYRVVPIPGLTHYVALAGQAPLWPYARWCDAASNIQDGVDAAWDGDAVAVSNGLYQAGGRVAPGAQITNRICITRAIDLYGVNGADMTLVNGAAPATERGLEAVRGLYAGTNALVRGFTFTGGHSANMPDLAQDRSGGGVLLTGGAELRHCIVTGNGAREYAGGVLVIGDGRVNNCLVLENTSDTGAGLCLFAGGEANHCTIVSNTAAVNAGGVYIPDAGTLVNGIVWANRAPPHVRRDVISLLGSVSFTCAGDGVTDGIAGCRTADPLFAPGGFRPAAGSPCINAGNNAQVVAAIDLKDDPRVVETVDMGAYEYLTAPAMPTGLAVTDVTGKSVTLHWQPDGVMPVAGYDIAMETLAGTNVLSAQTSGTATSLVVTGLSEGTGYRWRVRAANSQGLSGWTPWQTFFTHGVIGNVTPSSCNVGGGVEVHVEGIGLGHGADIDSVSLCGIPAVILNQSDDWVRVMAPAAPTPGTGHVRVSSPSGGDLVLSNAFAFLAAPAPALLPPTDVTATSLLAHWAALADAQGYQLQAADDPDFASCLPGFAGTNAPADAVSLAVFGFAPGTTNYLRLRARFAQGYGPFSATLAVPAIDGLPWIRNPIADRVAIAGKSQTDDLLTVFAGSGLTFTASSSQPGIVQPAVSSNTLTVLYGPALGMATVTVTATHTASGYSVSTAFTVEVIPRPLALVRINCGGKKAYWWGRDRGFSTGLVFRTQTFIENVKYFPMEVYQSCRYARRLTYTIPELPNGTYQVRLAFAELMQNQAGACVFKVRIEGVTVLPRVDVFAITGARHRAFRPFFKVVVKDGNGMQIQGIGLDGTYACFNGIMIMPVPPAGMGSIPAGVITGSDPDAGPYALTNKAVFYADITEVTKGLWDTVRAWGLTHGYTDLPAGAGKAANHPVQMVNWYDCVKWCNARSQMAGLAPAYYTTPAKDTVYTNGQIDLDAACVDIWGGYRLPLETEWEYAARGGTQGLRFPWGDTISHSNANYYSVGAPGYDVSPTLGFHPAADDGGFPYTCAVGSFGAYGFNAGLFDMAGNVAEWCWDPMSGSNRVVRGGAWFTDASWCRIAQRLQSDPALRSDFVGFRAVKSRP